MMEFYPNAQNDQLANFTEWNPSPIIELNLNGDIIYLNLAARALFPTLRTDGKQHPFISNLVEKPGLSKCTCEFIIFAREVDISNNIYEEQIFSIPGKNSIFIYISDITTRKKAEEDIKTFNKILDKRVNERTAELHATNKLLQESKAHAEALAQKAEESSRAKTTFLTTMSHEIRTPLNGVLGMANILLDGSLTLEQRECTETIRKSADQLLAVMSEILDYVKIESADDKIEIDEFDIHQLIKTVMDSITEEERKDLGLLYVIEKNVPQYLYGDSTKIMQILSILLNNAVKFTAEGTVILHAKLVSNPNKKHTLMLEVIDTGIGMSDEIKTKLFQPFSQGDSSLSRQYGGAGLGLAIAKRLVSLMNGSITVESRPGRGSHFSITLPLDEKEE